jgi:hypothetical protein
MFVDVSRTTMSKPAFIRSMEWSRLGTKITTFYRVETRRTNREIGNRSVIGGEGVDSWAATSRFLGGLYYGLIHASSKHPPSLLRAFQDLTCTLAFLCSWLNIKAYWRWLAKLCCCFTLTLAEQRHQVEMRQRTPKRLDGLTDPSIQEAT